MKHSISFDTAEKHTSICVSEDNTMIEVWHGYQGEGGGGQGISRIAQFRIEEVWDTLVDTLATIRKSPVGYPSLWRRKQEAIAALKEQFKGGEDAL